MKQALLGVSWSLLVCSIGGGLVLFFPHTFPLSLPSFDSCTYLLPVRFHVISNKLSIHHRWVSSDTRGGMPPRSPSSPSSSSSSLQLLLLLLLTSLSPVLSSHHAAAGYAIPPAANSVVHAFVKVNANIDPISNAVRDDVATPAFAGSKRAVENLQSFEQALGGFRAPPITMSNVAGKPFQVMGDSFVSSFVLVEV
jgi:hypothetical protein